MLLPILREVQVHVHDSNGSVIPTLAESAKESISMPLNGA